MKITLQIVRDYEISDFELFEFQQACVQYVEERYESCAIKYWGDVPKDSIIGYITDRLPDIMLHTRMDGIIIDDYFNTISFNHPGEDAQELVKGCVRSILEDIDYSPKFKQLLELSENMKTGPFGDKITEFTERGFELFSQSASIRVEFHPITYDWKVMIHDEDCNADGVRYGNGWNRLIEYLCFESDTTWFCNMSREQIDSCKLWKVRHKYEPKTN